VERLIALYRKNDAQFNYEILRNFSSPVTGFSRIFDWGEGGGFTVSRTSIPSIRISLSGTWTRHCRPSSLSCPVGVAYLKTLLGMETEKELAKIEPGPMYE